MNRTILYALLLIPAGLIYKFVLGFIAYYIFSNWFATSTDIAYLAALVAFLTQNLPVTIKDTTHA